MRRRIESSRVRLGQLSIGVNETNDSCSARARVLELVWLSRRLDQNRTVDEPKRECRNLIAQQLERNVSS